MRLAPNSSKPQSKYEIVQGHIKDEFPEHQLGDNKMLAYLVCCLIAGLACAAVSFVGFEVGILGIALWYVLGSWAGFAASVALFMLISVRQNSPKPY